MDVSDKADKADKVENSISNIVESDFEINKMQQEKQMYNSEYKRGHDDGIIAAENRCYENGFRDGVQV
jgi:flagellar biosynthesis/type III secretory pathway protein FliH